MKLIRHMSVIIMNFIWLVSFAQGDNNYPSNKRNNDIYNKLMKMAFEKYNNKTVDAFLKGVSYPYHKYIPTSKKPGYIDHVIFRYSDSVSVDIAVKNLGQKEPLNFNYKFKIEVFKTKKIKWICLRYGGRCIKGCEEENCN